MIKNKIINILKDRETIPLDEFMHLRLNDNEFGYYRSINPFGITGDFITAPEISQIFGEVIALWIADTWIKLDYPSKFNLIELGAGKGSLLSDILRVLKQIPQISDSLNISILEINKTLIEVQKETLKGYEGITKWYEKIEDLPTNLPTIIYSNEFFDAIPTKQYLLENNIWYELGIQLDNTKTNLQYCFNKCSPLNINYSLLQKIEKQLNNKHPQFLYEVSNVSNEIFLKALNIIKNTKGAMLTIDYGYTELPNRNTLRGYKNHKLLNQNDLLNNFESCDITYNVNFVNLFNIASGYGLSTYKIITQKDFLEQFNIHERTNQLVNLLKNKMLENINELSDKDIQLQITSIKRGSDILTNPKEMGEIFKVMAVSYGIDGVSGFKKP